MPTGSLRRINDGVKKVCAYQECGQEFERHYGKESLKHFELRETCSRRCAQRRRSVVTEEQVKTKICGYVPCSKEFDKGDRKPKQFAAMRYCGYDCAFAQRHGHYPNQKPQKRNGEQSVSPNKITVVRSEKPKAVSTSPPFPEGLRKVRWRPAVFGPPIPLTEEEIRKENAWAFAS